MQPQRQIIIGEHNVPTFLYGTAWKEGDTSRCVREAVRAGFRGIDTANQRKHYYEEGVGDALQRMYDEGVVQRADLFVQTKFTDVSGQDQRLPYNPKANYHTQVMESFQSSLAHLRTEYLDSYVLHGPMRRYGLTEGDWEIWRAMEELHKAGRVSLLGVSNVGLDQLEALCADSSVNPHFVQNRCFARTAWDKDVREFCSRNNIVYQGFSLLTANTDVARRPSFIELTQKYQCSGEQLIFCFALQIGMIALTGTTDPVHMKEDLEVYDIFLSREDIATIEQIAFV